MTGSDVAAVPHNRSSAVGQVDGEEGRGPLDLVHELCSAINDGGINYCHWKSNVALERSAAGINDLDLLIDEADVSRFSEIVQQLGFKEAQAARTRQVPDVVHFFGMDAPTGRLVHIHAHYKLIVGDDTTKNYRLPIERAYLESSFRKSLFRLPAAEYELVGFVIRMVLKHGTLDAALFKRGALTRSERLELEYLTGRTDSNRVSMILNHELSMIGRPLFEHCMRALQPGAPLRLRLRTVSALQRCLAGSARRHRLTDARLRAWRRLYWRFERWVGRAPRKTLATGGALIAVVGGDGAGKSSVVTDLSSWLGRHFVTTTLHLGKPPRSMLSTVYKGAIVAGRKAFGAFPNARRPPLFLVENGSAPFPGGAWLSWHLLTARDRFRAYEGARRRVSRGELVVSDRFPMRQIRTMDGPVADLVIEATTGRPFLARIGRWEQAYYERISDPDVLVVLRIDPDTAVARRRDEDEDFVRARCAEVLRADWGGSPAVVVDAGRPKQEVLCEIRAHVWSRL